MLKLFSPRVMSMPVNTHRLRKVEDGFLIYKTKQRTSQHQFVISFDFLFSSAPLLSRSTNFQQQQQRDDDLKRRRRWRERGNSSSSKKTMTKLRKTNISLLSPNKKLINFIRWIIIWRAGGMKWWKSLLWASDKMKLFNVNGWQGVIGLGVDCTAEDDSASRGKKGWDLYS